MQIREEDSKTEVSQIFVIQELNWKEMKDESLSLINPWREEEAVFTALVSNVLACLCCVGWRGIGWTGAAYT